METKSQAKANRKYKSKFKQIAFYVTEDEKEELKNLALNEGLSIRRFLLKLIDNYKKKGT